MKILNGEKNINYWILLYYGFDRIRNRDFGNLRSVNGAKLFHKINLKQLSSNPEVMYVEQPYWFYQQNCKASY